MRPTLRQLQYVVAVAETGRFHEAAKKLHVSQPSLSAQIADVEAQLGVTLMERGRGGAVMTPLGEDFVRRARTVLRHVEDLKAAMIHGHGELAGRFSLGVLPSIGPYLLPAVVKSLHADFPGLRLSVRELHSIHLQRELNEGQLDIVLSTLEDHPQTSHIPLFKERLWVCVAPEDALNAPGPLKPKHLKGRPLLSVGSGHRLALTIQQIADICEAYVSSDFRGTSLDAIRQMAAMGAGVAILPSIYALTEARRDPDLVLRPIEHPLAQRTISMIWRKASPLAEQFAHIANALRHSAETILKDEDEACRTGHVLT